MANLQALPANFDVSLVGDDSLLPKNQLALLRELVWRKSETDPIWFMENFWHVMDVETFQWSPFILRDYQREEVHELVERCKIRRPRETRLKARQIGWTTMGTAYTFWDVFFHVNHPWLIASQGESEAIDTLVSKIKTPYLMLPVWMRERGPQRTDENTQRMTFDNGSSVMSIAATGKAGRSKAVYGVLLDEFAFVTDSGGLLTALDPLCYGPLIIFSTANGMGNEFHENWLESERADSEWNGRFQPWHVVPGRDAKWYERELRKYRGREHEFYQEYPATPTEAFSKSGRTALPIELMRETQTFAEPNMMIDLSFVNSVDDFASPTEGTELTADNLLYVWAPPTVLRDEKGRTIQAPNYVVACDVAEGLDHGDRTSISVYDANTREVVATYLGHYPVEDLGELLEAIGYWYHTALIMPERNNHGILPVDYLRRNMYPRMYRMRQLGVIISGDRTPRYGWHTNKMTKPLMIQTFIKAIKDETVYLYDERFMLEAATFVANGKGGYEATNGKHDDHVISHLIGLQGVTEVGEYPIVWYDDTEPATTMADMVATFHDRQRGTGALHAGLGQEPAASRGANSFIVS